MKCHSALKRKGIVTYTTTRMDLGDVIPSKSLLRIFSPPTHCLGHEHPGQGHAGRAPCGHRVSVSPRSRKEKESQDVLRNVAFSRAAFLTAKSVSLRSLDAFHARVSHPLLTTCSLIYALTLNTLFGMEGGFRDLNDDVASPFFLPFSLGSQQPGR